MRVWFPKIMVFSAGLVASSLITSAATASLLSFETTPAGVLPLDDQALIAPYAIPGGTVHLFFDANHNNNYDPLSDLNPVFEHIGDDGTNGFASTFTATPDTARPGHSAQLGNFFLRPPTNGPETGPLIAEYTSANPINELSGEIWDIDGITRLGTERWQVDVLDQLNNVLASQLSPIGTTDSPNSLDSLPWVFQFHALPAGVTKLRLTFVGTKTQGLGVVFNNFSPVAAVPEPSTFCLCLFGIILVLWLGHQRGIPK